MGIEPETQAIKSKRGRIRVFTGVDTPEKPLSRSEVRIAALKASLIVGYSLHLLHIKNRRFSRLFFVQLQHNTKNSPPREPVGLFLCCIQFISLYLIIKLYFF